MSECVHCQEDANNYCEECDQAYCDDCSSEHEHRDSGPSNEKRKVLIHKNDEAGIVQFSVAPMEEPENWFDSFPTLELARAHVRFNDWLEVSYLDSVRCK